MKTAKKDGRKLFGFLPSFILRVSRTESRRAVRLRRFFRPAWAIIFLKGGNGRDGGVSGQRGFLQRPAGLPPGAGFGPAGGHPSAPGAVRPLRPAGRAVCGGGISAGMGLFERYSGETGGRGAVGSGGLRRGTAFSAADPADLRRGLRAGGNGAGPGAGGGAEHPQRPGHLLYQRQRKDPAAFRHWGLPAADGDLPGGRRSWPSGRAAPGAGVPAGADRDPDGPPGHGPQSPGRRRGPGADGGAPLFFPAAAGTSELRSGGGPALIAAALPGVEAPAAAGADGLRRRAAAQREKRLGGDRRPPLAGSADRSDGHGAWRRIHRPVGRRREEGP